MQEIFAVGVGGFLGSCVRFGINKLMHKSSVPLPVGTLLANVLAGFLIGFIIGLERNSEIITPKAKLFLTTGLLGGLSAFSTFSMETIDYFSNGAYANAIGNIILNLGLSFTGVILGLTLSKFIVKA